MLQILQLRLHSIWTMNFQLFKMDLVKAEEPEIKLPTPIGSLKKQESSRKISASALLIMPPVWIITNCGKFFKGWEYQTTLSAIWEIYMHVKEKHLELDMDQTDSKLGKEYIKGVLALCLSNLYVDYIMWNARLHEAQAGIKIVGRNIITSDTQMTPPLLQNVKN